MPLWSTTTRQWKRSAERAIGPGAFKAQREALALEVCRRIAAAQHAGRDGVVESAPAATKATALRLLDDGIVRAALGLKYLDALDESLRVASYEDAGRLVAEAQWARSYMETHAPCTLDASIGGHGERFWEPNGRLERLYRALTVLTVAEMAMSEVAA